MDHPAQLPPRLFELALEGSTGFHKRARWAALRNWAVAIAMLALGVMAPQHVAPAGAFVAAGVFVLLAMLTNAGVSLEPPNDLADGLQQRHVALVLHMPPRRGAQQLLFLRGPRERWTVRLATAEATELLQLLTKSLPSIPIRAYDGRRLRTWIKHWESQPWQRAAPDPAEARR